MAQACYRYADAVNHAKRRIEEAGAEVAATLLLGTLAAIFTWGATEGVTVTVATELAERVAAIFESLSGTAAEIAATIGKISGAILTSAATGALSAAQIDGIRDGVRQAFGEQPLGSAQALADVGRGIEAGAVGGPLGKAGEVGAGKMSELLSGQAGQVMTSDPRLFMQTME